MNFFGVLLLCGLVWRFPTVHAENKESCYEIRIWTVCKEDDKLLSINSTIIDSNKEASYTELIIKDTSITYIAPNAFKNLSIYSLTLELAPIKLDLLPESFNGLPNLKKLSFLSGTIELQDNLFSAVRFLEFLQLSIIGDDKKFPEVISKLEYLKNLKVINRGPTRIDASTFPKNFPSITELKLEYVNLSSIEPKSFASLKNLEILTLLESKQLTDLEPDIFYGLEDIMLLTIVAPNLVTVHRNVFNNFRKCQWLILLTDKVLTFEDGTFQNATIDNLFVNQKEKVTLDSARLGLTNSTRLRH